MPGGKKELPVAKQTNAQIASKLSKGAEKKTVKWVEKDLLCETSSKVSAMGNSTMEENIVSTDVTIGKEEKIASSVGASCMSTIEGEKKGKEGWSLQNKDPIIGYFHDVSGLKDSRNNFKYFNFNIQTKNDFLEGVCYEPYLHREISCKQEIQKPIKVSHYSLKESMNRNKLSVVINRRTKVENFDECDFEFNSQVELQNPINIKDMKELFDFETVTTVGKVHILSSRKKIKLNDGKELEKQECRIADCFGAIRMTVWEKAIDKISDGKFYKITNARVRSYQGEKYLSIGSDTKLIEIPYDKDVFPKDIVCDLYSESEIDIEKTLEVEHFNGIQMVLRYAKCKNGNCRKRLNGLQSKLQSCEMCGLRQIVLEADQCFLLVTVLLEKENLSLRFNDNEVRDCLKIFNEQCNSSNKIDPDISSESDISEALLLVGPLQIVYNISTRFVTSVKALKKITKK